MIKDNSYLYEIVLLQCGLIIIVILRLLWV